MTRRRNRDLRSPFVLTVSSLTAVMACSSQVVMEADDSAGGGGPGGAGTTSSSSNTSSSSSSSTTSGVGGHDGIDCPMEMPSPFQACPDSHPGTCLYDVDCQSGVNTIAFACTPGSYWQLEPGQACAYPHDSCPGTELYCATEWWMPEGSNPPSPCPDPPPAQGDSCIWGVMGGVHQHCGYPCSEDPDDGWTVATCTGQSQEGIWDYDGACDL